jgi:hypothetical protein
MPPQAAHRRGGNPSKIFKPFSAFFYLHLFANLHLDTFLTLLETLDDLKAGFRRQSRKDF